MRAEAAGRWLGALLLVLFAACLALALVQWPAWRTELPLWDLWPYAGAAFDRFDPAVIFRAHNEHVPATTAIVLWADRWLTQGTYVVDGGVNLALAIVPAAWAVTAVFRQPGGGGERPATAVLWLSVFAALTALEIAAHPFLMQHLLLTALGLGAALLVLAPAAPVPWPRVVAASLLCLAAVVTQANGVALPFVLLMLDGLRRRRLPAPLRALTLLLPALLVFLWLYLLREGAPHLAGMTHPSLPQFVDFLLRLAGAGIGLAAGSEGLARIAGGLVFLLAIPPGLALLLRPARLLGDRLGQVAATLFVLALTGLLASAWGRAAFTPSALWLKYGYYSLVFASTAALLNLRLLPPAWRRPALLLAASALLAVNAALLWRAPYSVERQAQQLRAEAAGYAMLLATPDFCLVAECSPDHLAVLRHWREQGLNVFAWPEARLLGEPLGNDAAGTLPACAAAVDGVTPLVAGDGTPVLRIDGWVAGRLEPRQALYVVGQDDPQRRLLGFGFASDLPGSDAGAERQRWRAYAALPEGSPALAVLPAFAASPCRITVPRPGGG